MSAEAATARARLATPAGEPGSGWARYAAAMTLWQAGELTPEALEVYRICATLDDEDPAALLAARGLAAPLAPALLPAPVRLRALLDEADRYLAALSGPGIAETRAGIGLARTAGPRAPSTSMQPVIETHLPAALEALAGDDPGLAAAIAGAAADLAWISYDGYAPGTSGRFPEGHAFASLIGLDAPWFAEDFDFGLFLMAPHLLYRDHRHVAPELYAPLTGPHGWRFAPGDPLVLRAAHVPVWNDPMAPHLTKVGAVPFLCLYAWTQDANAAAEIVPADDWDALEALQLT